VPDKSQKERYLKLEKLEILTAAAIFIQKNYRGHLIRNRVEEALKYKLVQEMMKNGEKIEQL